MSDEELERLRRRRLAQLRNRFRTTKENKKEKGEKLDPLMKVFVGRAWEVFNATRVQYPQVARKLRDALVQLVSSGRIKRVSGEELYHLLRKTGFRVKLKTTIKVKEHGQSKSLEEKLKE